MNLNEFLQQKTPFLSAERAMEIAKTYRTPFHIYHEGYLRENVQQVYDAFRWNGGGYREYFAVKANPNFRLLRILFEEGCGFDCSSEAELILAREAGARGNQIMFTSNDTPQHEFIMAVKLGALITLDDITHIEDLYEAAQDAGCRFPETIAIRWNPGGTFQAANGIMGNPEEAKYGMTTSQVKRAVRRLKELGVKHFGLHAFLASNTLGEDYYNKLTRELTADFSFVNLSGGVGIPYKPGEKPNDIYKIAELVEQNYHNIIEQNGLKLQIFTEMGRFITGPFGGLVTKVLHVKNTHRHYIGVDASAPDLMRPAIYGAYHHISVLGADHNMPSGLVYDITGALCENCDKFAVQREGLPQICPHDLLFIHDTGAHGYAMGYNYNGRLRHAELLLKTDGEVELIRRAETYKDYFRTMMINGDLRKALQDDPLILNNKADGFDFTKPVFCLGDVFTRVPSDKLES